MRQSCLGIAGSIVALCIAGCGESADEGPISYKGTDSPAIQKQIEVQNANAKSKASTTKGVEEKPAVKKEKEADKKPAGDPDKK